jgi:hypothetical protein
VTVRAAALIPLFLLIVSLLERGAPVAGGSGPYVVTAIDYHFHDAHPSLPIRLGQAVQFSNQGRNPHNVTIEGPPTIGRSALGSASPSSRSAQCWLPPVDTRSSASCTPIGG